MLLDLIVANNYKNSYPIYNDYLKKLKIKDVLNMATLRKIKETQTTETYTITVTRDIDLMNITNTYKTMSPETDIIVQILVYAHENNWSINQCDTKQEFMSQLKNYLTEDELLDVNPETLNANLDDLVYELDSIAPKGIEYITIKKNGDKYKLDVTKDDIRKIFLDFI